VASPAGLVIRADASEQIGTGHVMRCLAIAQAWQEVGGGPVAFAAAQLPEVLERRVESEGFRVRRLARGDDPAELNAIAAEVATRHVVVDSYALGDELEAALAARGHMVLAMDDFGHASHRHAHVVVNQNLYADADKYAARGASGRLLLGPRYALLRREFWPWRGRVQSRRGPVRLVLVTTGGADATGFGHWAIDALAGLPATVRVIIGGSHPRYRSLRDRAIKAGLEVVHDVRDMAELMAAADLALSAAGSTCWELLFMGVPTVAVALADNQRRLAESLRDAGAIRWLGWHEDVEATHVQAALRDLMHDDGLRHAMSNRGIALVDGWGARRVASVFMRHAQALEIVLRPARRDDEGYVWEVNNDPTVRRSSIKTEPIAYQSHVHWFEDKLNSPDTKLLIATDGTVPVGVLRLDRHGREARISLALESDHRGRGIGTEAIRLATQQGIEQWDLSRITALVRPENVASLKAFQRAGYIYQQTEQVAGVLVQMYSFSTTGPSDSNSGGSS
jgi:UDP-2,4-diacetamido-2,4,6-trideoxy-beta-L-altropyranose hydrolase